VQHFSTATLRTFQPPFTPRHCPHKVIVALMAKEILDEQIAKKLA
jgi:hypothetical protein